MNDVSKCAVVLSVTLVSLPLLAAIKSTPQTTSDKDFGKLSTDGSKVLRDIDLARLAIFNGQLINAKRYTAEAETALTNAKTDNTIFTKSEADLKPPAGMTQPRSGAASTTPINWIPVGASMTLGEDFIDTPEKSSGVSKANEQLKKGDQAKAMETLKLANVDVNLVMELAPLDKTTSGVKKASQLLDNGKYYEANQALNGVEEGFRFDVTDVDSAPKSADKKMTHPASPSAPSKK